MMRKKNGFTLMELLVVIAVLSIVGVIVLYILTSSLRESNKAQLLSAVKKNGQTVLETIDKTVRNSDNVVCVSSPAKTTLVVVKGGVYTRYKFIDGRIDRDNPVKAIISNQEETGTVFTKRICVENDQLLPSAESLVDTDSKTGVIVENGSFSQDPAPGYKDVITVTFTLKPAVEAYRGVTGIIDKETFTTSIGLR